MAIKPALFLIKNVLFLNILFSLHNNRFSCQKYLLYENKNAPFKCYGQSEAKVVNSNDGKSEELVNDVLLMWNHANKLRVWLAANGFNKQMLLALN